MQTPVSIIQDAYETASDEHVIYERRIDMGEQIVSAITSAGYEVTNPKDTTCNGWTNCATWRVNLELCNDWLDSLSRDVEAGYREPFTSKIALADELKETVSEFVCGDDHDAQSIATQYALAFLDNVNWYEIAETYKLDYPELFTES